jgi:hypothetical protein
VKKKGKDAHTIYRSNITPDNSLLLTNILQIAEGRQNEIPLLIFLKFNKLGLLEV